MTATPTATAAAQDAGHNTVETSFRWSGCGAPGRGYELRLDPGVTTGPEGGSLLRRAE
jgi:hypothetical protein